MRNEVVIGGESVLYGNQNGDISLNTTVSGVSLSDDLAINGEMSLNDTIDGTVELSSMISGQSQPISIGAGGGSGGTSHHDELDHRDYPNQHPLSAIAGLTDALNAKVNTADIGIIYCGTSTEVI